jgi:alanine racemase
MTSRTTAEISKTALRNNYRILARKSGGLGMLPMVKADAYGHGAVYAAKTLLREKNLHGFGVATFREAVELREGLGSCRLPIWVFSDCAPFGQERLDACVRFALEPVFSEITSLLQFQRMRGFRRLTAHVEVNTGMNRLGIPEDSLPLLRFEPGSVFTHLADAENPGSVLTRRQLGAYSSVVSFCRARFPRAVYHFANSAAIWNRGRMTGFDEMSLVRPGLSLYGVRPFESAREDGLRRVMRLSTRILNRIYLEKGDRVGYGGTYRCKKAGGEWIVVVGGGYAEGIFRSFSNQGVAYLGSKKLRFRGRVSMDLSAIEGLPHMRIGDELELWGARVDPYEQAGLAGTIPYEWTTRIGPRVERIFE